MQFNNLPIDIIKHCILPNLYDKDILKHFKGDPETGYLTLKDPWNAPHLNLITQFKNIMACRGVNTEMRMLVKHPFEMSFNDKIKFARSSLPHISSCGKLRKKLAYKIANRMKIKNTGITIDMISNEFSKKVKYNQYMLIQEMKDKFEPSPYHYSNDVCLTCFGQLPYYSPSIRKYWTRAKKEGYTPHQILKRYCSRKCQKKCTRVFKCAKCEKNCRPGTDIKHGIENCIFNIILCNPENGAVSIPKNFSCPYSTEFACSKECKLKLEDFHNEFHHKNVLIRTEEIPQIYGFIIDANTIEELHQTRYVVRENLMILNPNIEEFIP